MAFEIIVPDIVRKIIKRVPKGHRARIIERLSELSNFPHFLDIKKIKGSANKFRLRIGSYRAIFEVDYERKIVSVKAFGTRQKIERYY